MAIAYTATGQQVGVATETSGAACSPLCPSTVNSGDILIVHAYFEGTATTPSTPSGFTLLDGPRVIETTIGRHWIFGKIADGTEDGTAAALGTAAVTTMRSGRVYRFTGRIAGTITDLVNGFSATSHATDPQMPSVTTTAAGALACAAVVQNDNNALGDATGASGGTWAEATAEFVAALTPGLVLQLQTCTPTANPGTVSGGAVAATNDPSGVIGFQIRDSAPQIVSPSGVVHTRAFGTAKLNHGLIANAPVIHTRAFGTFVIPNRGQVAWAQMQVPEAGAGVQTITPSGLVHTRAFGTAVVVRGAVTVVPSSTVHSRTVTNPLLIQTVKPSSVVHTRAFGTAVVLRGAVTIVEMSVVHTRAFGTLIIVRVITASAVVHGRAFGTPVIPTAGAQNLLPQPVVHTRAFGTTTVVRGTVTIAPSSVVHTRAFGTAILEPRRGLVSWAQFRVPSIILTIQPSSVVHTRAFGSVSVFSSKIVPSSVIHTRVFGTASVIGTQVLVPGSVVHTRAFGATLVVLEPHVAAAGLIWLWGDVDFGKIEPQSIVHTRVFGGLKINLKLFQTASVIHARAFGTPTVGRFIAGISVIHTRAFGLPALHFTLFMPSVIHFRVLETPNVGGAGTFVQTTSILHARAFGSPTLTVSTFNQTIFAISVVRSRNVTGPKVTRAGDPPDPAGGQRVNAMEWGIDSFHPSDIEVTTR